jgi:hypothetical protein
MKKEGAANQAGEDGKGYVDEFLFHVLSFVCYRPTTSRMAARMMSK